MEEDLDEGLDPTQFMEEIVEDVDNNLEIDIDESGVGDDELADHIEIEEPPETQEI